MNGVINVYKEKGYTSHDVVAIVRRTIHQKRVGHTGTLDPEAEGVLPICIGYATKLAAEITDSYKEYIATLEFGSETDTGDHTGETTKEYAYDFEEDAVRSVVESFVGPYAQIPPMYSALKVNGKKLYDLARQGIVVERKPRNIHIFEIEILEINAPSTLKMRVLCSKGTYIRTLCEDIGKKLNYGAHMTSLVRSKCGRFELKDSLKLDKIKEYAEEERFDKFVMGYDQILSEHQRIVVPSDADKYLLNGNPLKFDKEFMDEHCANLKIGDRVRMYASNHTFIGLYELKTIDTNYLFKSYKMLTQVTR